MLELINSYAHSIVYYIIWLGGIVYAAVNRRKHPRTSLFAGIALGILLLVNLLSTMMSFYFQHQHSAGDLSMTEFVRMQNLLSLCTFPFSILGWLLLLVAIFGWKNVSEHQAVNSHID